ncbi:hypothetical protein KM043_010428 [Ampulex compressa]|nr:hypothetical protein KM043_010428 [Ampulex compressa]
MVKRSAFCEGALRRKRVFAGKMAALGKDRGAEQRWRRGDGTQLRRSGPSESIMAPSSGASRSYTTRAGETTPPAKREERIVGSTRSSRSSTDVFDDATHRYSRIKDVL